MLKKLMLATVASLALVGWPPAAIPRTLQQFDLDVSGDITADVISGNVNIDNKNKGKNISFQRVDFVLDDFWLNDAIYNISEQDGDECFPPGGAFTGSIQIKESRSGDVATAVFWFKSAFHSGGWDGTGKEVQYMLTLTDNTVGWDGIFPPSTGVEIMMSADVWDMATEGKGAHRHTSCKGVGNNANVTLMLDLIE